jgi:glycosyltransferase involved in cell wall biosynthesis
LSVIIPCYNAATTIAAQLDALTGQCWSQPWEVIVVNNHSTDASMDVVERYRTGLPQLRIVDALERRSRPYALNVGAAAAKGESLAFCDADDEIGPGWVAAIGDALIKYDFVASRFDDQKLNAAWVQQVRSTGQTDSVPRIWYPPYLAYAGCCGLGVKRALHERVGGFDESLRYVQEVDYCFKLQLKGVQLRFVPEALIHVRLRDTVSGIFHQARHWAEYNVAVYKKYQASSDVSMPEPWERYVAEWMQVLRRLRRVRSKAALASYAWHIGWQLGRLKGSLKFRCHPV